MKDILFDLDGTLTDPALGITNAVQYALKKYGIEDSYQNLLKFIGPPLVDSFMETYGFDEDKANEAVVYYREYFSVTGLYENKVYDGMEDFLKRLKDKGYRLSIATSKPEIFAIKILDYFHLSQYFDFICGATMDKTRNKKGDVIAYALDTLQINNKNQVIMIGDRMHDIIGAHENDIKVIGVLYGYGDLKELQENHADYIVRDLDELYAVITGVK
ncbi:MAG: HAD family hydrolase [Coprobacillus sp.]